MEMKDLHVSGEDTNIGVDREASMMMVWDTAARGLFAKYT